MRKRVLLILLFIVGMQCAMAQESLNMGWRFCLGDVIDAEKSDYDDSQWQVVDVPHDFQIHQPWVAPEAGEHADNSDAGSNVASKLSSRGFKAMGIGWYRRTLDVPKTLRGKRLLLDFEGIMYVADVYVNGQHVGKTDYGYVGFEVDITDRVRYGESNIIAVKADTRAPENSRWYTGGGLFRDVRLLVKNRDLSFARHPLHITTRENRYVDIEVETICRTRQDSVTLQIALRDPSGQLILERRHTVHRHRAMRNEELLLPEVDVKQPKLWSCNEPNLYTLQVRLLADDGTTLDEATSEFGIRTIDYSPDHGFRLNGEKVLLKGVADHHSLGALGAAAYERAIEKRILLLKEFGVNHIRTSHNPYSESFLRLCDRHGILVVDELYDKWLDRYCGGRGSFMTLWQNDVPEFVKRDRNHPCVVMWSLGNELQQYNTLPFNDFGVTQYRLMRELLLRYDTTRPTTVAMHPRYRSLDTDSLPCDLAQQTDIAAYNYRYMYFPGDARRFPDMVFYQSEASVSAMGPNFFDMDLSKVVGLAYWGAIDYLGESGGWPAKGWAQGVFDISLEPKPKAYLMKSMFCEQTPVVHIGIRGVADNRMWNGIDVGNAAEVDCWSCLNGQEQDVCVYTNADEVELLLNGKSLGIKPNVRSDAKRRNQVMFEKVPYADGRLTAVARNSGKEVARHELQTTGPAVALKIALEPSADGIFHADGSDLAHLRIYAVDARGRRVYDATGEVTVSAEGLTAVCSGNIASDERFTDGHAPLYHGTVLAILRAGTQPKMLTVTATCPGLKSATTRVSVFY